MKRMASSNRVMEKNGRNQRCPWGQGDLVDPKIRKYPRCQVEKGGAASSQVAPVLYGGRSLQSKIWLAPGIGQKMAVRLPTLSQEGRGSGVFLINEEIKRVHI